MLEVYILSLKKKAFYRIDPEVTPKTHVFKLMFFKFRGLE